MYLLFWAMPLLFAIGVITGAFRATRVVFAVALAIAALTVVVAIDGHASLTRGDYCDTGFDCPNLDQALFFGGLTLAVLLLPHLTVRGVRTWGERPDRRRTSGDGTDD